MLFHGCQDHPAISGESVTPQLQTAMICLGRHRTTGESCVSKTNHRVRSQPRTIERNIIHALFEKDPYRRRRRAGLPAFAGRAGLRRTSIGQALNPPAPSGIGGQAPNFLIRNQMINPLPANPDTHARDRLVRQSAWIIFPIVSRTATLPWPIDSGSCPRSPPRRGRDRGFQGKHEAIFYLKRVSLVRCLSPCNRRDIPGPHAGTLSAIQTQSCRES